MNVIGRPVAACLMGWLVVGVGPALAQGDCDRWRPMASIAMTLTFITPKPLGQMGPADWQWLEGEVRRCRTEVATAGETVDGYDRLLAALPQAEQEVEELRQQHSRTYEALKVAAASAQSLRDIRVLQHELLRWRMVPGFQKDPRGDELEELLERRRAELAPPPAPRPQAPAAPQPQRPAVRI